MAGRFRDDEASASLATLGSRSCWAQSLSHWHRGGHSGELQGIGHSLESPAHTRLCLLLQTKHSRVPLRGCRFASVAGRPARLCGCLLPGGAVHPGPPPVRASLPPPLRAAAAGDAMLGGREGMHRLSRVMASLRAFSSRGSCEQPCGLGHLWQPVSTRPAMAESAVCPRFPRQWAPLMPPAALATHARTAMTVLREANAVLVQALNQSQQQESESAPPQGSRVCSTGGAAAKDRQQQGEQLGNTKKLWCGQEEQWREQGRVVSAPVPDADTAGHDQVKAMNNHGSRPTGSLRSPCAKARLCGHSVDRICFLYAAYRVRARRMCSLVRRQNCLFCFGYKQRITSRGHQRRFTPCGRTRGRQPAKASQEERCGRPVRLP